MRAAVFEGVRKPLVVREMPDPTVAPDGVIVRVEANGICRTDWHLWTGDWTWVGVALPTPHVFGHEFCGVIEETGKDVKNWKAGDRVLVPFSQGEGTCEWCRSGHQNVCDTPLVPGVAYWGGYGRRVAIPFADVNLVRLPDGVAFVGEWLAVHGCGGVGLSAVQIGAAMGASVIAVDVSEDKLAAARGEGALHTINASKDEPIGAILGLTGGGAQVSIDALGVKATCLNSVMCTRKRGRHVQVGLTSSEEQGQIALPIDIIVLKEVQIIGSLGMQAPNFSRMLHMVESRRLNPGKLVHRKIRLEEASGVLESMDKFGTVGVTVINQY
jgi:D-arabinose 1-dehydrogenase-like Zn-dependent alcohol dehydrogenase